MVNLLLILGILFLVIGYVGCLIPVIPGPLFGFLGLLTLSATPTPLPGFTLGVAGALVAFAFVLDYVVPSFGAKAFNCSKWGIVGCTIGTLVGVFFMPFGIVLGPFLGAVLGELLAGKQVAAALKGGFGAFLGFLLTVVLKFALLGYFTYLFVATAFK